MAQQKARNLKFETTDIPVDATSLHADPFEYNFDYEKPSVRKIQDSDRTFKFSEKVPLVYLLSVQLLTAGLGFYYFSFWPAVVLVGLSSSVVLTYALFEESFLLKLQGFAAVGYALVGAIFASQLISAEAGWQQFLFCSFAILISSGFLLSKLAKQWLLDDCVLITHESEDEAVLLDPQLAFAEKKVLASSIKGGDILRYYPEELVYADGIVLSGVAEVEQRLASGQSRFCIKGKGDPIFAGSSIVSGTIDVKVELVPEASNFTRSVQLIKSEISKLDAEVKRAQNAPDSLGGISPHVLFTFGGLVCTVAWGILSKWEMGFWCGAAVMSLSMIVAFVHALKPILLRHLLISAFARGVLVNEFLKIYHATLSADKIACLDVNHADNEVEVAVADFEVSDDRVDGQILRSVIVSILGRSEAAVHLAIAQAIREQSESVRLYEMSSATAEEDIAGVTDAVEAVVEGITFRMGSEEWLISRGVMIQPNELSALKPGVIPYIIAMGNDVVAVVSLVVPADATAHRIKALSDLVRSHRIRTVLISNTPQEELTHLAKQAGVELENIFPVNGDEATINRLSHISPVTLIAPQGTSPMVEAAASVVARPYQFYEHVQLKPMSFGFLGSSPMTVGWFVLAIRKCQSLIEFQQKAAKFWVFGLAIAAAFGVITAPLAVTSAIILGVFLFMRR